MLGSSSPAPARRVVVRSEGPPGAAPLDLREPHRLPSSASAVEERTHLGRRVLPRHVRLTALAPHLEDAQHFLSLLAEGFAAVAFVPCAVVAGLLALKDACDREQRAQQHLGRLVAQAGLDDQTAEGDLPAGIIAPGLRCGLSHHTLQVANGPAQ